MKTLLKKATGGLLLAVLLLLASCSGVSTVWSPGVITAEAATKKVALSKKSTTLAVGGKTTIQLKNINTKKSVSWSSSNKKVATVKKGSKGKATITAKKAGSATITAKYGGKKYTLKVAVKSPALSKKSVSITAGKKTTIQLKNTVSSKKLTWKSSKTSVVTVKKGSSGKVTLTAKKKGTATVTATYNGKKYSCKVTVKAVSPKLSKSSVTVPVGGKVSVSLSNPVKGKKTTWKSSSTSIATVKSGTNKVTITGKKAGKVTVTATHNGKKYKCTVTVKAQSLSKTSLSLKAGGSATITLNNPVSGKSTKVSTSNAKVAKASVKSNKITIKAVGAGSATIKVAHNGKVLSCKVKVAKVSTSKPSTTKPGTTTPSTGKPSAPSTEKPPAPSTEQPTPAKLVSSIHIVEDYTGYSGSIVTVMKLKVGETEKLDAMCNPYDATNQQVTWASSNPNVATIGSDGMVTAKNKGTSTITCTARDGSGITASCQVTVTSNKIWLLDEEWARNITVAGGETGSASCRTILSGEEITVTKSNDNIVFSGFNEQYKDSVKGSYVFFIGRRAGTCQITFSNGDDYVTVNVTVTSDDVAWWTYDNWIRGVLSTCGYGSEPALNVLIKLGIWLADNRSYSADNVYYVNLATQDGDCEAHTNLFLDVAIRFFGLEAKTANTGYGHTWAIVTINGVKWTFDAGYAGTAGHRTFSSGSSTGEGILYGSIAKPDGSDFRRTLSIFKDGTEYAYYERNASGDWIKM